MRGSFLAAMLGNQSHTYKEVLGRLSVAHTKHSLDTLRLFSFLLSCVFSHS
jgi:hypothetical protein